MKIYEKIGLLPRIVIAILLGVVCSSFFSPMAARVFVTINGIFGNFLSFAIPLIILGLVAPGIATLGKGAGRLLAITAFLAYGSTLFSGFFSFFTCDWIYPKILEFGSGASLVNNAISSEIKPFFMIDMPPIMDVTGALLLSFILGIGFAGSKSETFVTILEEFKSVIVRVINSIIIPFLPLYIFGISLKMGVEGQVLLVMGLFVKVIVLIFIMHVLLLLFQYVIAAIVVKGNPFRLLRNMLPAYMAALGTQSSAAAIPVTLASTRKNGVNEELAGFVIPLCATIHLSGSILKIVACAMAIMYMTGMDIDISQYAGFIMMLGITMIAAPGVPGGAIMAALGLLQSMLGFDETLQGLMIALYITMDSFGTAGNVIGDGAIALIVDKIHRKK